MHRFSRLFQEHELFFSSFGTYHASHFQGTFPFIRKWENEWISQNMPLFFFVSEFHFPHRFLLLYSPVLSVPFSFSFKFPLHWRFSHNCFFPSTPAVSTQIWHCRFVAGSLLHMLPGCHSVTSVGYPCSQFRSVRGNLHKTPHNRTDIHSYMHVYIHKRT